MFLDDRDTVCIVWKSMESGGVKGRSDKSACDRVVFMKKHVQSKKKKKERDLSFYFGSFI